MQYETTILDDEVQSVTARVKAVEEATYHVTRRGLELSAPPMRGATLVQLHDASQELFHETVRLLTRVEQQIDTNDVDVAQRLPRNVVSEHSDRYWERFDEDLAVLVCDLLKCNKYDWLWSADRDVQGHRQVRDHGLTSIQLSSVEAIESKLEGN